MGNIAAYHLVQLVPDDWQQYKTIRLESLRSDPQAFGSNYAKESLYTEEKWRSRLVPYSNESKQWIVNIADENNVIVGTMAAFNSEPNVAYVVGVYVKKEHRGQGLASMLMGTLLAKIKEHSEYSVVKLTVNKEQTSAVALYKKFGFVITKEGRVILGDGKEYPELEMKLEIL
jgi:ribosomal protein S18 acetylase RimI-like enzyme